jgi:WS/DGAT/MGAT family acyltransferase
MQMAVAPSRLRNVWRRRKSGLSRNDSGAGALYSCRDSPFHAQSNGQVARMTTESMNGVDLAWLRMERPTNPMVIVAVLVLDGRVSIGALRSLIRQRLLRFERFRQMPVHGALGTHWQTDPHFHLESHVRALRLPPRAGQAQLEAAAGRLAGMPLDTARPLWQVHLAERYRHGSALIARFHHCYADGIALMRVLLSLTDPEPEPEAGPARHDGTAAQGAEVSPGWPLSLLAPLTDLAGSALSIAQHTGDSAAGLIGASLQALTHPERAAALARQVADAGRELAGITLLPEDPPTPLKGELSTRKQVAWADPLSLFEVKTVAASLGCTINDVLLATVAGALGTYLARHGCAIDGVTLRALVPVNLRPPSETPRLGNEFGLVFASLPVGERNPIARLYAVHQDMERLKHSSQALVALWLLTAMGSIPGVVEDQAVELFTSKASAVVSNVPGPRQTLWLCGARIEQQFFWVPQAGSIGVGVSLLTYDGRVHFGVMADRNVIAVPREIARAFLAEFERLLLRVVAGSPLQAV